MLVRVLAGHGHHRQVELPADHLGYDADRYASSAIAVFRVAFERWLDETNQRDLPHLIQESLDELKAVTAGK